MDDLNDQIRSRLAKLDTLNALGIAPFGRRFVPDDSAQDVHRRFGALSRERLDADTPSAEVAGRIVGLRRFGKAAFVHLQDASGRIQTYLKRDALSAADFAVVEQLDLGDYIGVRGRVFRTKTEELTVEAREVVHLAKALRPLPEKWHGLTDVEIRYRQRYLDLIANPEVKNTFVRRSRIIQGIRNFFNAKGFLEVETPMMQGMAGGAAARPFVTHHNALSTDLYLRIAPELYLKRLIVGGFERVYEINRNFRNEGISTIHNPEFTMLEFYLAYADVTDLLPMTEDLITTLAKDVCGTLELTYQGKTIDLRPPWKRIGMLDAVAERHHVTRDTVRDRDAASRLARSVGVPVKPDDTLGQIQAALFEHSVEADIVNPTFITDFPTDISPLAKRRADDHSLTERFELLIAGREVANGFSELNDPIDQRQRFEAQAAQRARGDEEAHRVDEDFLRALEHGMPPTAGEGIGIDRLVMLLTDQSSIRDVILFPQMKPEAP
ncbi:MAG: lysine--tRNA ligase [Nitrospirota bacterium]